MGPSCAGGSVPEHWEHWEHWEHCPHSSPCLSFPPLAARGGAGGPLSAPPAMPGVPLPFVLLLLLLAGTPARSFPRDLVARSTVGLAATAAYPRFGGLRGDNGTARLGLAFQRMLRLNGTLLVAARDHIYAFDLRQDRGSLYPERVRGARGHGGHGGHGAGVAVNLGSGDPEWGDWGGGPRVSPPQDECHNYIRVLVPRDAETLLACGTNAFSPLCRTYQVSSLAQQGDEVSGQARCPFDAKQSIVALFVDGSLYSATVADFQASDAVIYRSLSPGQAPLRTLKYSSRWLQEPHFVQVLPYGPYVYFFFREVAVELSALGKVLVARVARVCRNDRGGSPRVLERRWTSFLKVRLQCSVPGDTVFYFDVLEAVTPPQTLHGRPAVLALFGTQPNSIPGSAVCAFYLADVERSFEGPFAEPRGTTWAPVPEERVPQPRPGCCAGMGAAAGVVTSGDFPDETLLFAKEHPLLHGAVGPAGGRPLFTHTGTRLTQLAVDTGAGPRGNHTVLFLGAEDGRLLKVLAAAQSPEATQPPGGTPAPGDTREPGDSGDSSGKPLLLEEISLYDPGRCRSLRGSGVPSRVLGLELHLPGRELLVAFAGCLLRLPLSRCARHGSCRGSCLAARDPYCVWLPSRGCVPFSEDLPSGFQQDVEGSLGISGTCQGAAEDDDEDGDLAHGVRHPGPGAEPTVPVPVLVGCVLGAFALGALATGLVATCCQRPAVPKAPPEPPCAPRSPAQPAVPRLYPALPPQGGSGSFRDPPEPQPEPPAPPPAFGPHDRAPVRLDVPPDSPPAPRRPLAPSRSLGGTPVSPPGPPRGLTRMHSLGTPGGTAWGPRPGALERSLSVKPPVLPKPLLLPAAPGDPELSPAPTDPALCPHVTRTDRDPRVPTLQ
ncbi:semaphorin-6C [Passer montanus]|uniref:semaphorin-6C n=1 Tax=Passer montanus TaxID=9160 RepID=UPI00195F8F19|nr:semaphorin-6C [Passer montanus]